MGQYFNICVRDTEKRQIHEFHQADSEKKKR